MPPEQELNYTDINDFSPGIFQGYSSATVAAATPAPLGAAQMTGTYRCLTMPGGGLRPGPKKVATFALGITDAAATSPIYLTGFTTFGPVVSFDGVPYADAGWLTYEYVAGSTRKMAVARLNFNKTFTVQTLKSKTTTSGATGATFRGTTSAITRMSPSTTDPTQVGIPIVVIEWADLIVNKEFIIAIPDPAAQNVFGSKALYTEDGGLLGQVLAHQGRVVLLSESTYGVGDATANAGLLNNESIQCTDPANANTAIQVFNEIFVPESPTGYGAWGSISAGELILIKNRGGAVLLSGDILNPQVTRLIGVVGTGGVMSKAASTKAGLLYATSAGIFAWTGGQSSAHVSPQLTERFWDQSPPFWSDSVIVGIADWLDWAVCSGGWLFDIDKTSWWQLDNPADHVAPLQWFDRGFDGRYMYGVLQKITDPISGGGQASVVVYDRLSYATNYSWQSQPIPGSINRFVNVRELVLVAQGTGTVTVTCTAADNTTQVATFTITSNSQPVRQRQTIGVKGFNIVLKIVSDGGSADAPVVYSLGVGTYEALHAQART